MKILMIQSSGSEVSSPAGDFHLAQVNASSDPGEAGSVDVVILATKSWDVETAVTRFRSRTDF